MRTLIKLPKQRPKIAMKSINKLVSPTLVHKSCSKVKYG